METQEFSPKPQIVSLSQGGQAVINGALVTASTACTLEVGSGGFVLTGRSLWRDRAPKRNPREELYFSILDVCTDAARFDEERFRLFRLLAQVVVQERTHEAQKECSLCAAALIAGNAEEATRSASRLASQTIDRQRTVAGKHGSTHPLRRAIPGPGRVTQHSRSDHPE